MTRKRIHLLTALLAFLILCVAGWLIILKLNRVTLLMEAQIIRPSGEIQPISSATFYLLDTDMLMLAMSKGNESDPLRKKVYDEHPNLGMVAQVMDARRRNAYSLGAEVMPFVEQSRPLWEPRVVQSAQTDAQGRAVFRDLKPGDYWLMCRTEAAGIAAFWNQRVTINRGENQITLDQTNALYLK
jgi:hypothetical protein